MKIPKYINLTQGDLLEPIRRIQFQNLELVRRFIVKDTFHYINVQSPQYYNFSNPLPRETDGVYVKELKRNR